MSTMIDNIPIWLIISIIVCIISITASSNVTDIRNTIVQGVFGYIILAMIGPQLGMEMIGEIENCEEVGLNAIPFFKNLCGVYDSPSILVLLMTEFKVFLEEIFELFLLIVLVKFCSYFVPKIRMDRWWILVGTFLLNYIALAFIGVAYIMIWRFLHVYVSNEILLIVSISIFVVIMVLVLSPIVGMILVVTKITKNPALEKIMNIVNEIKVGNGLQCIAYANTVMVLCGIVLQQLGILQQFVVWN